jgi:hypothetical protein
MKLKDRDFFILSSYHGLSVKPTHSHDNFLRMSQASAAKRVDDRPGLTMQDAVPQSYFEWLLNVKDFAAPWL